MDNSYTNRRCHILSKIPLSCLIPLVIPWTVFGGLIWLFECGSPPEDQPSDWCKDTVKVIFVTLPWIIGIFILACTLVCLFIFLLFPCLYDKIEQKFKTKTLKPSSNLKTKSTQTIFSSLPPPPPPPPPYYESIA